MVSINNVTVRFGGFALFNDISFMISPGDKIGLVGKNGAGKSTLMKIICNIEAPSEGVVSMPEDIKIGYLPQKMVMGEGKTVLEETRSAFTEIIELKKEIELSNQKLAESTDYESDAYMAEIHKLTEQTEHLHILGGDNIDAEIEQTLKGLGFKPEEFNKPTNTFSGGWRMRIELAKILLKKPNIFLLDEPTNHLDIESIQWLEDFLKTYQGAVLLVSHDRAFLDNVTNRTVEISMGKIYDYKAPYSHFVNLRKERIEQQKAAYENQRKMIEETEKFIERFRYQATKAVQVQSRIKQLEKLDRIEIDDEDTASVNFRFPPAPRSGDLVVESKNLSKAYGEKLILEDLDFIVERGEKIAFVGKNGEGKTTFSRVIIGELEYSGNLKIGHNVDIGYFAQNQDEILDESKTVFETLDDIAVGEVRKDIRSILGSFLFSGESIDKKVKVLSGGERNRLALAKLLLHPYNLLVLDEPTNHLDMRSKEILKNAVNQYDGTVIVVSHDRDFLDGLVTKVYEFKNKKIKESIGGIYDFLEKLKKEQLKDIAQKKEEQRSVVKTDSQNKQSYLEQKEYKSKLRKIENRLKKSEEQIETLEAEIESVSKQLESPESVEDQNLFHKYQDLQNDLEKEMESWESISNELDEFKN